MTPSLPTLSIASAIRSPILRSCAEIVATSAICALSFTTVAFALSAAEIAATAASIPALISIGCAPAAKLRRPSLTIACARTVAVVVPSPATSLVLVATSLTSCAPMFSTGSDSSISLAIVTPSFVMVGAPKAFEITTLRPLGPRVTLTVSARMFTPRSMARRACSSNCKDLPAISSSQLQREYREQIALNILQRCT
ncbi:unannotated protein [freshwater metagenome]|uniref:Unannotated protein n=1 Tax=freshwater metagenome TaxID=449393 RepID=A0A6J6GZC3_9ZZZZ